jgi:hypothetical protein
MRSDMRLASTLILPGLVIACLTMGVPSPSLGQQQHDPLLRRQAARRLVLEWHGEGPGRAVLCARRGDGRLDCHATGVRHRRQFIAEATLGAFAFTFGIASTLAGRLVHIIAECDSCKDGRAWMGVGGGSAVLGLPLLITGITHSRRSVRAHRWLLERNASASVAMPADGSRGFALSFRLSL